MLFDAYEKAQNRQRTERIRPITFSFLSASTAVGFGFVSERLQILEMRCVALCYTLTY